MAGFGTSEGEGLVLFDGAMGTYLYQQGVFIDKCFDALNLTQPDLVRKIHRQYIEAGARVIETNTFGANRIKLERHALGEQLTAVNREGARIAREAAEGRALVAGSIGPLGVEIEPWGELPLDGARRIFAEQAAALVEGGVDGIVLETFHDLREMEQAVRAVRDITGVPVLAMMTVQDDGKSRHGADVEEIVDRLNALPVDALGFNCTVGPRAMLDFIERAVRRTGKPVAVMPNAGLPQTVDGRTFYMSTPDYFCVYAKRFIEAGARILGGCCGTTPEHIRKMAESIAQKQTRTRIRPADPCREAPRAEPRPRVPLEAKSALSNKVSRGRFAVMVEMTPPRGREVEKLIDGARRLMAGGIDAINIPDGPRASARLTGLALAVLLQEKVGIETVLHVTCRDHSLLGMQSALLGASVLGVRNVLAVTGDPPMMGDYPQSTAVFDVDSIGLTRLLDNLNQGLDVGSKAIGEPTGFFIGVGVDPSAVAPEREIQRFRQKVEAGAEFAVTQPVFDPVALESFLEKVAPVSIPVFAGIWPLASVRNAEFMRNEVPGVTVPDSIVERMGKHESRDDQMKTGMEIAREMVRRVRPLVQGLQISAPFGRVEAALAVAEAVEP
jgi:methionine synthase / methylenetetrahydrofolate reductase(NADPH)